MKESIGYTVTLNIIIIFIVIVFAFLSAALIYFRSNKVSNVITSAIEKYEGYNDLAKPEITSRITSLGYNSRSISCPSTVSDNGAVGECKLVEEGNEGYCVYLCKDTNPGYYYYRIRTNLMINIPIINNIIDFPIFSNTNRLYDFGNELGD